MRNKSSQALVSEKMPLRVTVLGLGGGSLKTAWSRKSEKSNNTSLTFQYGTRVKKKYQQQPATQTVFTKDFSKLQAIIRIFVILAP